MTTEKVDDLETVPLASYFDSKKFRLIPADAVHIKGGISEVPVEFNLHPLFAKQLDFDTRNLQKLYGFGIITGKMAEVNHGSYYSENRGGIINTIELNDCGKLWIFKFEFIDKSVKLYSVKTEDVARLLNECRKPILLDVSVL